MGFFQTGSHDGAEGEASGELDRWRACFVDAPLERGFREHQFKGQRKRGMAVLGIVTVLATLNLLNEVSNILGGREVPFHILALRLSVFAAGMGAVAFLWRARSQPAVETFLTAYGLFLVAITSFVVAYHPGAGNMAPTTVVGAVALIYFFAPLQFARVVLLAAAASVGGWVGWVVLRGQAPADDAFRLTLWLFTMNLVGFVGCNAMNRTLRALFWERRQLELQKARAEGAYERERIALGQFRQFAELISHEFRNPLAIVKGKAQLLQLISTMDGVKDPEALPAIERAVHRLDTLFSQWLSSDRMADGDIPFAAESVRLDAVFRQVEAEVLSTGDHPIAFAAPPDLAVRADPVLLRLMLSNLIDNAQKYSPGGGDILVTAARQGAWGVVQVRDHGMGIAPDKIDRVFDKYFRVSNDSGIRGFGIGLFMVRRIMDLHGGSVALESTPGAGTTVFLTLPLASPDP